MSLLKTKQNFCQLQCVITEAGWTTWSNGRGIEPEKHWGLFTVDRRPKLVMRKRYSHLAE